MCHGCSFNIGEEHADPPSEDDVAEAHQIVEEFFGAPIRAKVTWIVHEERCEFNGFWSSSHGKCIYGIHYDPTDVFVVWDETLIGRSSFAHELAHCYEAQVLMRGGIASPHGREETWETVRHVNAYLRELEL